MLEEVGDIFAREYSNPRERERKKARFTANRNM